MIISQVTRTKLHFQNFFIALFRLFSVCMLFLLEFMSPSPVGQYKMKVENRKRCLPNNNHSAQHSIPQSAVRSPEPTLPPRADPWDTTQSAIDHRVWTPGKSEQRFFGHTDSFSWEQQFGLRREWERQTPASSGSLWWFRDTEESSGWCHHELLC